MVFSSFIFLFGFLPLVGCLYVATPRRFKNAVLLIASMGFYGWGAPFVLPLLLTACVFDYVLSFLVVPGRLSETKRRWTFGLAVASNLAVLFYYKYLTFFVTEYSRLLSSLGVEPLDIPTILLPIGISFFTFHKISYLGDVYRGKVVPARSLVDYALYILFFPQLIAGPIIRYADIAEQLRGRTHSLDKMYRGINRFCLGFAKKVLVADSLGGVADQVWAADHAHLSTSMVWLAAISYSFQIYFDFSGYSDMAIGLAKMFGFTFRENFDRPYRSRSFTEFWRRWHISLSGFMREYLYIPLGGNRVSRLRMHMNLWITFLLSGLWHGAAWNFVFWGAFHGLFLSLDRLGLERALHRLPRFVSMSMTFLLVTVGWVFFRSDSLTEAFSLSSIMLGFGIDPTAIPRAYVIDNRQIFMLLVAVIVSFAPSIDLTDRPSASTRSNLTARWGAAIATISLFWIGAAALASRGYTPFLYFKF